MSNKINILYLANYIDEDIFFSRSLNSRNVAGSNRILRIATALSLNNNVSIISPAITGVLKKNQCKKLVSQKKNKDKLDIWFSSSYSISYLCLIFSFIFYTIDIFKFLNATKNKVVFVYNFNFSLMIIIFFMRLRYPNLKIVNHIEDISIPSILDFKKSSEDRPIQQIIFYMCMKFIARLSNAYIVPSEKFLNYLPNKKIYKVIRGCIDIKTNYYKIDKKINILFAGKIAFEHGIDTFINSVKLLSDSHFDKIGSINICGSGPKSSWLINEIANSNLKKRVFFHGFVNDFEYQNILNNSHICISLQNPEGRHKNFKSPSKVYEYMGNSKVVITSNVGDFSLLPDDVVFILSKQTPEELKNSIINSINSDLEKISKKIHKYSIDNFSFKSVSLRLDSLINDII